FGEDIGGVGPEVRAEEVADRWSAQLLEVGAQLLAAVAPGEVGVRLAEAELGKAVHDLRTGERLGQKHGLRAAPPYARDEPFPQRERLGMRIVDAKDAHALVHPEFEDARQFQPQLAPVAAA